MRRTRSGGSVRACEARQSGGAWAEARTDSGGRQAAVSTEEEESERGGRGGASSPRLIYASTPLLSQGRAAEIALRGYCYPHSRHIAPRPPHSRQPLISSPSSSSPSSPSALAQTARPLAEAGLLIYRQEGLGLVEPFPSRGAAAARGSRRRGARSSWTMVCACPRRFGDEEPFRSLSPLAALLRLRIRRALEHRPARRAPPRPLLCSSSLQHLARPSPTLLVYKMGCAGSTPVDHEAEARQCVRRPPPSRPRPRRPPPSRRRHRR